MGKEQEIVKPEKLEKKTITKKEAQLALKKNNKKAEELLKNEDKMEEFLQRLEKKLKVIPMVGETFAIVPAMISLVRSYVKKEYTKAPLGTIVGIVSALIYILSPIDLVPDIAGPLGYLDDADIILVCLKAGAADDIKEYEEWRKTKKH